MASNSHGKSSEAHRLNPKAALDPIVTATAGPSRLELVSQTIMAPFTHRKVDSTSILSGLAPVIMTPRMMNAASNSRPRQALTNGQSSTSNFVTLGRAPFRLGLGTRRISSRDLQIVEATNELLSAEVPEPEGIASNVSLLRGFNATIPSSEKGRSRRKQMRNVETPRLGLKKLGMNARGLITNEETDSVGESGQDDGHDHEGQSVASEEDVVVIGKADQKGKKKRGRESLSASKILGKAELQRQTKEILRDKENLHVRRSLINNEVAEITHKIEALDLIREQLENDLLQLQEDELELDDELEGVRERMEFEGLSDQSSKQSLHHPAASRRRRGPAFLPSEHDELPTGVAFMTLNAHNSPITALDFSEPYGTLVSASQDDGSPRVWDLFSGSEVGRLRGHRGTVKCVQVEDHICLTGGDDGNVRLWDLRKVDEEESWDTEGEMVSLSDVAEEEEDGEVVERPTGTRTGSGKASEAGSDRDPCARLLQGHSKAVTALYFEDDCLVTGASDRTLRQWDLTTGQCVMTMDIMWAISHPVGPAMHNPVFPGGPSTGRFAFETSPFSDGSVDVYEDFVGGVQFWGYGLVSGSGDGAVRMWDMRTGQAHRTLLGHSAPVTCLQFDELHIVSGSLDKTIRIWDLRTGGVESITYDHPITSLQFDSRKILAATGQNGIKVYNRTSTHQSTLLTNGHTAPVSKLRYMDRYMVSAGRDSTVKIWSL